MMTPAATLVLHVVFGLELGGIFGALGGSIEGLPSLPAPISGISRPVPPAPK
jgi:hypothetical protein